MWYSSPVQFHDWYKAIVTEVKNRYDPRRFADCFGTVMKAKKLILMAATGCSANRSRESLDPLEATGLVEFGSSAGDSNDHVIARMPILLTVVGLLHFGLCSEYLLDPYEHGWELHEQLSVASLCLRFLVWQILPPVSAVETGVPYCQLRPGMYMSSDGSVMQSAKFDFPPQCQLLRLWRLRRIYDRVPSVDEAEFSHLNAVVDDGKQLSSPTGYFALAFPNQPKWDAALVTNSNTLISQFKARSLNAGGALSVHSQLDLGACCKIAREIHDQNPNAFIEFISDRRSSGRLADDVAQYTAYCDCSNYCSVFGPVFGLRWVIRQHLVVRSLRCAYRFILLLPVTIALLFTGSFVSCPVANRPAARQT